jgi:exocyst complex component 3
MEKKIDSQNLDKEARQNAAKHVSNMLQRPHQLDKVEQYRKRILRKKSSVEGMLKTAMQTQLDGVKSGFIHLKSSLIDIQEAKAQLKETEDTFQAIPGLVERLRDVREESMKHTQYAAATENLKHIFNVPECVQKTRQYIGDGKLLLAHQQLHELETSRDGLLYELHRLPATSQADKNMLKHYFSDVEKLSEELGKQLWFIIRLALNSAKKEPSVIVNALRIIEREEKADQIAKRRFDSTGFMSPGRPKQWRKRVFEILEEAVSERIAGNQLEDRTQEKMWLVRHLEISRRLILEDLKVVKYACVNCFPPYYNIVSEMLRLYHKCLSQHLQELATQLEGNEFPTLLSWVQKYEGPDLLGHPELNFDPRAENLDPLLSQALVDDLCNKYLSTIDKNYKEWMLNTINRETKDWYGVNPPETDDNRHYQTTTPIIVYAMIDQHLEVAKTVGLNLVSRVLLMSMGHLSAFAKQYSDAILQYSKSHFDNRSKFKFFHPFMIAVTNNCIGFTEILFKFCSTYEYVLVTIRKEFETPFKNALEKFEKLREDTLELILKDFFLDVEKEISRVGTKEWLEEKASITESVCLTLDDYVQDYKYLKETNYDDLSKLLQDKLAIVYIQAMLQKKITFKDSTQRELFARKFEREVDALKVTLNKYNINRSMNQDLMNEENPFNCVPILTEFLKLKDLNMLFLEVSVSDLILLFFSNRIRTDIFVSLGSYQTISRYHSRPFDGFAQFAGRHGEDERAKGSLIRFN